LLTLNVEAGFGNLSETGGLCSRDRKPPPSHRIEQAHAAE
jgi:hypothetical protein